VIAMSENLDRVIQEKEKELRPLYSRMEDIRLQFVADASNFAATWYEETTKQYVTKHSEVTLKLSREELGQMKAKVNRLIQNADKITKEVLADPKVWWHLAPIKHVPSSSYEQLGNEQIGNKFPAIVDRAVRRALGELGTVLEKFGYRVTTVGAVEVCYPEYWFEYSEGPDSLARPFFPHLLEWSKDMQYTIQKYSSLFKKAIALFNEIEKLKEEKKKRQARDLWDAL
jgi:predicted DNA binding CopG/RHH family protein